MNLLQFSQESMPDRPYLTVIYPAQPWLALPAGQWRKLPSGEIEVWYRDADEFKWSVLWSVQAKAVEKERATNPEQISMFGTSNSHYGRD